MTTENKEKGNAHMWDERLLKTCELFAAVRNGKPAVMFIVVELVYRTVCATWAPKMITVEIEIKKKKKEMPNTPPFRNSTAQ